MSLDASTISQLPSSVSLICEAGTGYNNIDLVAARERNIGMLGGCATIHSFCFTDRTLLSPPQP